MNHNHIEKSSQMTTNS